MTHNRHVLLVIGTDEHLGSAVSRRVTAELRLPQYNPCSERHAKHAIREELQRCRAVFKEAAAELFLRYATQP